MADHTIITPGSGDSSSGVNTVLIILVIGLLVAGGAWWYRNGNRAPAPNNPGINVDVNLPTGSGSSGGTNPSTP
ncbi:MAG: hypothetical protein M3Q34_04420 [bacterium]|nr:hypothetical protein [bacterium]